MIFFDFDGVLTDNKVFTTEEGKESVICSRADGIAFKALKKLNIDSCIISSETNKVVSKRAKKLGIKAYTNTRDKKKLITEILKKTKLYNHNVIFVGNDINDYRAMKYIKNSLCPNDCHERIKKIAAKVLKSNGGSGVAREVVEKILKVDILKLLY